VSDVDEPTTRQLLARCVDGIGQLLSSVEKLVVVVGVQEPGAPSISMQLRDMRERLGRLEAGVGRVEAVAVGARESADRTHALLLNESDELGAADKSMQAQIEDIGERLDGIAQRESNRAGAKP
jgi:hypothetical protein